MSTSRLTARLPGLVRPLYTLPLALSNTVDWSCKSCLYQRACILISICVCRYNYNFRTNINWLGQTNGYLGKVSVDVEPARLNAARPECSLNLQSPCEFQGNIISTMPTVQALDFSVIDFSSFYQNYVGFPPTNAVSLIHMPNYFACDMSLPFKSLECLDSVPHWPPDACIVLFRFCDGAAPCMWASRKCSCCCCYCCCCCCFKNRNMTNLCLCRLDNLVTLGKIPPTQEVALSSPHWQCQETSS